MIRFTVSLSNQIVSERTFPEDHQRIAIGRTPDNDLVLDNMALSRRHAEIVRTDGRWRLRDLGSRNGVWVNGAACRDRDLAHGDVLVIGKFSLAVALDGEEGGAPAIEDPAGSPDAEEGDVPALAHLSVQRGTPTGVYVLRRDAFSVGGGSLCDLRLGGLTTPRKLALIVRGRAGFSLVNVSSRHGSVYRNGKPVPLRSWLEDGDRVEFPGLLARFRLGPPRPGRP